MIVKSVVFFGFFFFFGGGGGVKKLLRVLTENRYKLFLVPVGGLSSRKGAGQYEELTNQIQFDRRVQALRVLFCFGLFSLFRSLGGRQWARKCAVYECVGVCARAQKYSSPIYLPLSP